MPMKRFGKWDCREVDRRGESVKQWMWSEWVAGT
jgi:hypothetical protein